MTTFRSDRLGMKLDPVELAATVLQAHYIAFRGPGGDLQFQGECFSGHAEAVVPCGRKPVGKVLENAFAVMMDIAGFSMHRG